MKGSRRGEREARGARIEAFAQALLRRRVAVIAGTLLLAAGALPVALALERDDSVRAWFEPGAPALQRYDAFEALFGSDEVVVLVLPAEDPFSAETLSVLETLTVEIEALPEVDRVWSLANVESVAFEPDGSVFLGELVPRIPPDAREVARARELLRDDPFLRTRVVSANGDAVSVIARLHPAQGEHSRHRVTRAIRALGEREGGDAALLAGQPVLDEAFFRLSSEDMARLVPVMLAVMAAVLGWVLRSLAAVLLPLCGVAVSVTLTLAAVVAAGRTTNILVDLLPLILLIVGVFSAIHLVLETQRAARAGAGRREAVVRALARVAVPTLAANLTTAAGFASFLLGRAPPVQTFGGFAALGIVVSCALSLGFLPACLSFFALGRARPSPLAARRFWLRAAGASREHPAAIVGAALALGLAAALALPRLERTEDWLDYFPEEHPMPRAVSSIEERFFGVAALEVVLQGPRSVLLDPAVLRRIGALAERLAREPEVERAHALTDFLEPLHRALHGGEETAARLPDERAAVEQYLLLLREPGGDLARFLAAGETATRVSARVRHGDGRSFGRLVELAEREAAAVDPRLETFVTGITDLNFQNGEDIVELQATSLLVAFPVVTLVAGVALRSVRRMGVVAIASALPVLGGLGAMVLLGVPLSAGSALVGSIALGFVVDDAVFLLARLGEGAGEDAALARALADVGPGLAATSLVVCAGFAVLGLSAFTPTAHFGLLTCLALVFAFGVNVLVLPSLVRLVGRAR